MMMMAEREGGGDTESEDGGGSRNSHTTRANQAAPTHQGFHPMFNQNSSTKQTFSEKLWKLVFSVHLIVVAALIAFLSIRGFVKPHHDFHPRNWYIPLMTTIASSAVLAMGWILITIHHPQGALTMSLWLAPLLTFAVSVLLFNARTGVGLAFALPAFISSLFQALYGCWVASRLEHARQILSASVSAIQAAFGIKRFMVVAMTHGFLFSGLWVLGVGGVAAHGTRFAALYVTVLLLSLAWTMQVIRNTLHVAISHIAYIHFTHGITGIDGGEAFKMTHRSSMGNICLASLVVPTIGLFRGIARGLKLVAGGHDEFLFSCANCYMGIADRLVIYGNRWGFVHVGAHHKRFFTASRDVWEAFTTSGLEMVVDFDLTSSFCFLCGVAGGMLCALIGGIWVIVVNKSYTVAVSVYGFLSGYFMIRVAMALPQACVSAYHVAYAENPQNPRVGPAIRRRIRELQSL